MINEEEISQERTNLAVGGEEDPPLVEVFHQKPIKHPPITSTLLHPTIIPKPIPPHPTLPVPVVKSIIQNAVTMLSNATFALTMLTNINLPVPSRLTIPPPPPSQTQPDIQTQP